MEYKTMRRAVEAVLSRFPAIARHVKQAAQDPQQLISRIRKAWNHDISVLYFVQLYAQLTFTNLQIMQGAHAARNADANVIRRDILVLSQDDAEKRGWSMPAMIKKADRGIKSECTARFLLPFTEREKYLEDPAS